MTAHISREELLKSIFETIESRVKGLYDARDLYYLSKECLWLAGFCPGSPDLQKSPYFAPFSMSFTYLLKKGKLDDAAKIYDHAFQAVPPIKMVGHFLQIFDQNDTIDNRCETLLFIDRLFSFLANLGYEETMQEALKKDPLTHPNLELAVNLSWLKLFDHYLKLRTPTDCFNLLEDLFSHGNKIALRLPKIKSMEIKVKTGKYMLKRRLLGIYTAALAHCLQPGYFDGDATRVTKKNLVDWVCDAYEDYLELLHNSAALYIEVARDTLMNIQNTPCRFEDIPDNLVHQLQKVTGRFSDVGAFFAPITDVKPSLDRLRDQVRQIVAQKPQDNSINALIDWIDLTPQKWEESDDFFPREELDRARNAIAEAVTGSLFWDRCRRLFTPQSLKVLTASLENKYATESAYFFETPSVKLDKGKNLATELCLLKKWGSTAAIFEQNKTQTANFGGGYFLYHNGFGLAVDPGPDFLKHLTRHTDFDLTDIGGIVCTHTHYDHFADFERIVLGIREYNLHAGYKRLYYLLPDADDQAFHPEKIRENFCVNVFEESAHHNLGPNDRDVYYIPDTPWGRRHGIKIQPLEVVHEIYRDSRYGSDGKAPHLLREYREIGRELDSRKREPHKRAQKRGSRLWSHGLVVMPLKDGRPISRVLFTGDAEYETGLFEDIDPDLLIVNFSSLRFKDITTGLRATAKDEPVKQNQLGYTGTLRLLDKLSYKLAVIGDFFEGQCDIDGRLLIAEALKEDLVRAGQPAPNLLISEPGTRIRWSANGKMQVYCSHRCSPSAGFVAANPHLAIGQLKNKLFCRQDRLVLCCENCLEEKKILGLKIF